jgi:hypothetical protein
LFFTVGVFYFFFRGKDDRFRNFIVLILNFTSFLLNTFYSTQTQLNFYSLTPVIKLLGKLFPIGDKYYNLRQFDISMYENSITILITPFKDNDPRNLKILFVSSFETFQGLVGITQILSKYPNPISFEIIYSFIRINRLVFFFFFLFIYFIYI